MKGRWGYANGGKPLIIIVDTREQKPYDFTGYADTEVIRAGLPAGDYSIPGAEHLAAVERKSLDDLVSCLLQKQRNRFERELARLRPYHVAAVVVEGSWEDIARQRYRSNMHPQAALQSILALQVRYSIPFMFCGSREGAQYVTHGLLCKYLYEVGKIGKAVKGESVHSHAL